MSQASQAEARMAAWEQPSAFLFPAEGQEAAWALPSACPCLCPSPVASRPWPGSAPPRPPCPRRRSPASWILMAGVPDRSVWPRDFQRLTTRTASGHLGGFGNVGSEEHRGQKGWPHVSYKSVGRSAVGSSQRFTSPCSMTGAPRQQQRFPSARAEAERRRCVPSTARLNAARDTPPAEEGVLEEPKLEEALCAVYEEATA